LHFLLELDALYALRRAPNFYEIHPRGQFNKRGKLNKMASVYFKGLAKQLFVGRHLISTIRQKAPKNFAKLQWDIGLF
jgi:hypothetical protein